MLCFSFEAKEPEMIIFVCKISSQLKESLNFCLLRLKNSYFFAFQVRFILLELMSKACGRMGLNFCGVISPLGSYKLHLT